MATTKSKVLPIRLSIEHFKLLEKKADELKLSRGTVAKAILTNYLQQNYTPNPKPLTNEDLMRVHYREIHRLRAKIKADVLEQIPGKSKYHVRTKEGITQCEIARIIRLADLDFEKKYKNQKDYELNYFSNTSK